MKWEYLIFNMVVILGPILAIVFYPKAKIPKIKASFIAIIIPAVFFIIWDLLATGWFWDFNPDYISGIKIIILPLEEILFFFTVPWACLFLWENLKSQRNFSSYAKLLPWLTLLSLIGSFIFFTRELYYTATVLLVFSIVLTVGKILKTEIFQQASFSLFAWLIFFLTLIFNGYLTARPIVVYNNKIKTNLNILTIPIEDILYGLTLILWVIILYENALLKKSYVKKERTRRIE